MILCCGEALIDMIPRETVDGAEGFVPHAGGAVFNTAIALGRLGQKVDLLTGLSTDMFGAQLADGLRESHVDSDHVLFSDRPTTLAFVKLTNGQAEYTFNDENTAGRMLTPDDMPDLPDAVTALYFGGISLACEPCADAYAALLAREGAGRAVMIDPNIRPDFIQDEDRYRTRLDAMLHAADIVKVSDDDLDWIVPGAEPLDMKAKRILAYGAALVLVTRGGDGATGYLASGDVTAVQAHRADVVDTVGAGDTFNAGVLAALEEAGVLTKAGLASVGSQVVADALDFGGRVAAVTVSRAGANPPWRREV